MFAIQTMIKMKREKDFTTHRTMWHIEVMRTCDRKQCHLYRTNIQIHFDVHELHNYDCIFKMCLNYSIFWGGYVALLTWKISLYRTHICRSNCSEFSMCNMKMCSSLLEFRLCFRLNEKFSTAVVWSNPLWTLCSVIIFNLYCRSLVTKTIFRPSFPFGWDSLLFFFLFNVFSLFTLAHLTHKWWQRRAKGRTRNIYNTKLNNTGMVCDRMCNSCHTIE